MFDTKKRYEPIMRVFFLPKTIIRNFSLKIIAYNSASTDFIPHKLNHVEWFEGIKIVNVNQSHYRPGQALSVPEN